MLRFNHQTILQLILLSLPIVTCLGQSAVLERSETGSEWRSAQLISLEQKLSEELKTPGSHEESLAQKTWLTNWKPGAIGVKPTATSALPSLRQEPLFYSPTEEDEFTKQLAENATVSKEAVLQGFTKALLLSPDEIGLQQLQLHWIDNPVRRKSYLPEIEVASIQLIRQLENREPSSPKIQLAIEHAMYRRGRALAYRELPVVVKEHPIEDQAQLNRQIMSAYNGLITRSGKGHPEFILLEIRILRRAKQYGSALEAAKVYAKEFPAEVAKELASQSG